MISEFVDEFKKDIPDNETELIEKFKSYLYSVIYNIKKSKSKFVAKDSESIKELLDKITKQLISEDLQGKKRILISDDNYEKINEISNEIFQLAQRKLNNEDIKIEFEDSEKIKEMQNLLKDVKEYNIQKAKKLISEAILDLNYINEKSTDICSLRLGYIKNNKEER